MASAAASPHRLYPPPPQVVQAYFAPLSLAAPGVPNHPIKALWGFERVSDLGSGESATVTFSLGARDLQLSDLNGDLVLAPGKYNVTFENGAGAVAARTVTLTGERVVAEPFPQPAAPAPQARRAPAASGASWTRTCNASAQSMPQPF